MESIFFKFTRRRWIGIQYALDVIFIRVLFLLYTVLLCPVRRSLDDPFLTHEAWELTETPDHQYLLPFKLIPPLNIVLKVISEIK